jgi:hypothetical protein
MERLVSRLELARELGVEPQTIEMGAAGLVPESRI